MHSISEVIIPNNDQHQHKKNSRINSKIRQQLLSIGIIVSEKFCSENVCLLFTSLPCMDNNSLAKRARGMVQKHVQFWQGDSILELPLQLVEIQALSVVPHGIQPPQKQFMIMMKLLHTIVRLVKMSFRELLHDLVDVLPSGLDHQLNVDLFLVCC